MDGCRERRRISQIQIFQLFQCRTQGNGCHTDIHHFIYSAGAHNLHAQQFLCILVHNEFCDEVVRTGIVMGFIVIDCHNGFHIITCRSGCCFVEPCSGCIESGQFHNSCTQYTSKFFFSASQHFCQHTSFHICRGAHGRPRPFTCQTVGYHRTVPSGVNIRQICPQRFIYQNGAVFGKFQTGFFQKCSVWTDAQRKHHHIRRDKSLVCLYTFCFFTACDTFHFCGSGNMDTDLFQMSCAISGKFRVKTGHHLRCHIHNSYIQALFQQVFRHFQTNKAAAGNNSCFCAAGFHIIFQTFRIIRSAHGKYAFQIDPLQRRNVGGSPCGDDTCVIRINFFFACCQIFRCYSLSRRIQFHRFSACQNLCPCEGREFFRCIDNDLFPVCDDIPYIIRKTAASVRNIRIFGEDQHFRVKAQTFQFRRYLCTCCHTA